LADTERRLRAKSDELLHEADRLRELEHEVDTLPIGSFELRDVARDAELHGERMHDLAKESGALSREAAVPAPDPE
jgi:hypothetical protein